MESVSQENGEKDTLETLVSTSSGHLERLVEQQLTTEGLDLTWAGTIQQLAQRICAQVRIVNKMFHNMCSGKDCKQNVS